MSSFHALPSLFLFFKMSRRVFIAPLENSKDSPCRHVNGKVGNCRNRVVNSIIVIKHGKFNSIKKNLNETCSVKILFAHRVNQRRCWIMTTSPGLPFNFTVTTRNAIKIHHLTQPVYCLMYPTIPWVNVNIGQNGLVLLVSEWCEPSTKQVGIMNRSVTCSSISLELIFLNSAALEDLFYFLAHFCCTAHILEKTSFKLHCSQNFLVIPQSNQSDNAYCTESWKLWCTSVLLSLIGWFSD